MNPFSALSRNQQTKTSRSNKSNKEEWNEPVAEPKFPIKQFEYIEGRNYRPSRGPQDLLPCDDEEIERLQINHLLFKSLFIKPYFAPVTELMEKGIRVLSVSAGPGCWALDLARQFPKSHFTATDSVIYPISNPPANCHFRLSDTSTGLAFPDNTFDYVTQFDALFKYSRKDWTLMIQEIARVTKPGGYIELVENGGTMQDVGPNLSIWIMRLTVSLQTRNIDLKIASQLESMIMEQECLEHLESSHRSAPVGWYGKNGDIMLECLKRLLDSIKPKLCEDWSMSAGKYDKMAESITRECVDFKSWCNFHYTIARKK
ncbi:S-adenosyl-L-methionine-dependent methyltransferase [Sporodiniella umbellata]|nr:S-adenosyl-L-methionine-dependent methyltransferase [Sporodiniella umbellata]